MKTKMGIKEYYISLSTTSLTEAAKSGLAVSTALNQVISESTVSLSSMAKSSFVTGTGFDNADIPPEPATSHTMVAKQDLAIGTDNATFSRMWVPATILESVLPVFVQTFEVSRVSKGKSRKRKYYEVGLFQSILDVFNSNISIP